MEVSSKLGHQLEFSLLFILICFSSAFSPSEPTADDVIHNNKNENVTPRTQFQETSALLEELLGGTLTLPCNINPPEDDTVALILWYKDKQSDAIFTYDARRGVKGDTAITLQKHLEGRATFHLGDPSYLSLKSATLSDSGSYECRVDFIKAPSRTTFLKLIVVDPPKSLLIKKVEGDLISFTVSANLGETLKLSCIATGGHPRPEVRWSINKKVVDVSWDAFNDAMTQNDLKLMTLTRDLHQAQLACEAFNSNITKPITKDIILLLNLPPKSVEISGLPKVLHSGRSYNAKCTVSGARPDPIISWTIQRVDEEPIVVRDVVKLMNPKKKKKKITTSKNFANQILNMRKFPELNEIARDSKLISRDLWKDLYHNYRHETIREITAKKRRKKRYIKNKTSVNSIYNQNNKSKLLASNIIRNNTYAIGKGNFNNLNINRTATDVNKYLNFSAFKTKVNSSYLNAILHFHFKPIINFLLHNTSFTSKQSPCTAPKYNITVFKFHSLKAAYFKELNLTNKRDGGYITKTNPCDINYYAINDLRPNRRLKRESLFNESLVSSDKNKSNIHIKVVVDSWLNDAKLSCVAVSSALPTRPVTSHIALNVHYAPKLEISLGSPLEPNNIREGMDVYFQCFVDANPEVTHIEWLINDRTIRPSPREGVLISAQNLVFQRVRRQWSGTISCRAANRVAASSSLPFELHVMFVPVCVNTVSLVWAGIGEEVVVPCRVLSHPPNITFHWTLTNSVTQEPVQKDRVVVLGLESQIRYRPEKPHDYGRLQCWAENILGRQKKPCVVTVKTAGSPSPPLNCSVYNQTWMSFDIACGRLQKVPTPRDKVIVVGPTSLSLDQKDKGGRQITLNGGGVAKLMVGRDRIRYLLSVQESGGETLVYNVSGESGHFRVTGLTPGIDYVIRVSRFNNHGKSKDVRLEAITLRAAENRMREEGSVKNSSNHLAVAISGILVIILLVLMMTIGICLKGRKKQSRLQSDKIHLPTSASPTGAEISGDIKTQFNVKEVLVKKSLDDSNLPDISKTSSGSEFLQKANYESLNLFSTPKAESSVTTRDTEESTSVSSKGRSIYENETREKISATKKLFIRGLNGKAQLYEKESYL